MKLHHVASFLHQALRHRAMRWLALPALGVAALTVVVGQVTPPPLVNLANEPLYARGVRAKPTLSLALSVEFPTVGQAYSNSVAYTPTTEFVGYFDPQSCYYYDDTNKRFEHRGPATNRACGGEGFSGNFMNWATTSAIDILRFGLTGGDRITDTSTKTVLQRAVIPSNFYNSTNFRSKSISYELAQGALPSIVLGEHQGTVYIANCLNRVFFGTQSTGSCDSPGNNSNLGAYLATADAVTAPRPVGFTECASEGGTCTFTGTKQVVYGADNNSTGGTGAYSTRIATSSISCNNTTFGDPVVGVVKRCYYRDVPPASGTLLNRTVDAFYTTRVSVCDVTSGALADSRRDLCVRYPAGNYKPVGNLQKYSDRLRVAAFGYLRDDNIARYGGVLRAPMKYVGPQYYDADFNLLSGTNPNREWDEQTGVFYDNPDSSTEFGVSGVTNYLNRFGRTGATPGVYKTHDPVGELYYESLRYIQGLGPTAEAISNLTTAQKDGFPVYTSWTDPHPAVSGLGNTGDYSCVKNNILAIGDVNTHADKSVPGNARTSNNDFARTSNVANNEPDFVYWTRKVGAFEANRTSETYPFVTRSGTSITATVQNPNTPNSDRWGLEGLSPPCCNGNSYYMAGMAYWANTHDIRGTDWTAQPTKQRPGMRARTYIVDVNEYGQQDDANVRRDNQFYLAAKYGGFNDQSNRGNPFYRADGTVDNTIWQQGNAESDPRTYFLAGNPQALLRALDSIFEQIVTEANSIAGGAITTKSLTAGGGTIFQATFDPSDWSGDILAYPLTLNGQSVTVGGTNAVRWRAATRLAAKTPAERNIVIGRPAPVGSSVATAFTEDGLDGSPHLATLRVPRGATAATPADPAASAEERIRYLRGDRSLETPAGPYRRRGGVLGDIVNSGIVYKGEPTSSIAGSDYYSFYAAHLDRTKALYVGANDGMLHAFNSQTGDELFAYIPSFVVNKLVDLTSPAYTHRSYVDATPTVGEANLNASNAASADWRTVLVSGAGGGGQGVFALDVTDPSSFSASSVLWEFTDAHDVDLGNVVGRPQLIKVRTSAPSATPVYKWYAVVASGVNNYQADDRASSTGNPVIFFLDVGKPAGDAWALGQNYFKLVLPQSLNTMAKGAISFSVSGGSAGEAANLYAGDLQGNLWKFNFTGLASANATTVDVSAVLAGNGTLTASAAPMFVARAGADEASARQPISMEPTLAYGPNRSIIVTFGTGKFLEAADNTGPYTQQSVYAVLDGNTVVAGRGRLQQLTQSGGTITGPQFTWDVPTSDTDATRRAGWYFDFAGGGASGERQVSDFALFNRQLVFGSLIPPASACSNGGGNLYTINLLAGSGTQTVSTVGIPTAPFFVRTSAAESSSSNTGARQRTETWVRIDSGSGGAPTLGEMPTGAGNVTRTVGRLTWRQIYNYRESKQ